MEEGDDVILSCRVVGGKCGDFSCFMSGKGGVVSDVGFH